MILLVLFLSNNKLKKCIKKENIVKKEENENEVPCVCKEWLGKVLIKGDPDAEENSLIVTGANNIKRRRIKNSTQNRKTHNNQPEMKSPSSSLVASQSNRPTRAAARVASSKFALQLNLALQMQNDDPQFLRNQLENEESTSDDDKHNSDSTITESLLLSPVGNKLTVFDLTK